MDERHPSVCLTSLGSAVMDEWRKTVAIQASKGRKITLHAAVCMPDHFHGVIEVGERMDVSIGNIILFFKGACTSRWRDLTGFVQQPGTAAFIRHASAAQRSAYYASRPRIERPLFDDNYDDTICLTNPDGTYDRRHLSAMIGYVNDNPRRAVSSVSIPPSCSVAFISSSEGATMPPSAISSSCVGQGRCRCSVIAKPLTVALPTSRQKPIAVNVQSGKHR